MVLFAALPVVSCVHPEPEQDPGELSVSIYIPDVMATKADTGPVGALSAEKVFSSLQLWVFLSGGSNDGQLVGYKGFTAAQLADTGVPHSAVTRFGMPLTHEMFNTLSADGTLVDVYAVANAASATSAILGESTTRSELDAVVISGSAFGVSPLTMSVPSAGLPMSGVLKSAPVTGSFPVLNVSTLTLTRAVSKLRFVFCQQGTPATDTEPSVPSNTSCVVKSITFGGTSTGHNCQIAEAEKLFTENASAIIGYTPLTATLTKNGGDLMSNPDITVCANPEELLFHGTGHETETAQEYETRLDAAIAASSQCGPIYIRETDKLISGTITYNTGGEDVSAAFSMPSDDVLSRNHSWILYAYFSEFTRTLQLKIVVLPWDKYTYNVDFTTSPYIVNVIRRFTIPETDPQTFAKVVHETNGYFDIHFWPVLEDNTANSIKGSILIDSPVGQKICIEPIAGAEEGYDPVENIFSIVSITPREHTILYPNHEHPENSRSEDCEVEYTISCNIPDGFNVNALEGNYIDLHFGVRIGEGENARWIDLDSESIDYYRICFHVNWKDYLTKEED